MIGAGGDRPAVPCLGRPWRRPAAPSAPALPDTFCRRSIGDADLNLRSICSRAPKNAGQGISVNYILLIIGILINILIIKGGGNERTLTCTRHALAPPGKSGCIRAQGEVGLRRGATSSARPRGKRHSVWGLDWGPYPRPRLGRGRSGWAWHGVGGSDSPVPGSLEWMGRAPGLWALARRRRLSVGVPQPAAGLVTNFLV